MSTDQDRYAEAADDEALWLLHRNGKCDEAFCQHCKDDAEYDAFDWLDTLADIPATPTRHDRRAS